MDKTIYKLVRRFQTNDPFAIAEGLNIHVRYANLGEQTRGLYYRKLRRRFIVIHETLSEEWQRFICAHELGHDRLHPGINRFWIDDHSLFNVGKLERQANKFAVRLLTIGDTPEIGESLGELLRRNNVPEKMQNFYY
jgi:Zn-dependent peptidase ImmA (M78 family)